MSFQLVTSVVFGMAGKTISCASWLGDPSISHVDLVFPSQAVSRYTGKLGFYQAVLYVSQLQTYHTFLHLHVFIKTKF